MSRLSMRKISEILRQRFALNRSFREIAHSLNISISTASCYARAAKKHRLSWPLPKEMTDEQLYRLLFPKKATQEKKSLPDWRLVQQELRRKGVTLQLLWREYKESNPDGVGYTRFCHYYREHVKTVSPVMRQTHKAGEKTFVDYAGTTMEWINPATGEIYSAQIFVGALGASQYLYVEATQTQSLPDWLSSHIHMFEYFGGVSEIVVPDNLKAGVDKAHRYDPDINQNYQHFGEHYGFAIVPARVRAPKDKAIVENAVGIVTRQILAPLRHVTFTSLSELNAAIKARLKDLNHQPFQKLNTTRSALFEKLDKPALKPLPCARYHYADWAKAKVHIDYHFQFEKHCYSVPYQYIQQGVEIRASAKTVECFYQGKRIASHTRSYVKNGYTTLKAHMPPAHRAQIEWGPERIRRWAKKIGRQTAEFIEVVMASRPYKEQSYRACLGILRLAKRYGENRLERACIIALQQGMTRYKQIEFILKNKMDNADPPTPLETSCQKIQHKNIRGADYFK